MCVYKFFVGEIWMVLVAKHMQDKTIVSVLGEGFSNMHFGMERSIIEQA